MASYDDTSTVSGSVVSFPNGADDVPTKSLVVTIPPTLSGVSSVSETQTGKNLFNEDWEIGGINDTTGVPNSDTNKIRSKTFSQIKGGTTCYVGAPQNIRVLFYTSSEAFISETANIKKASFSVPSNCALFKIRGTVDYGTTYNNDIIICYGSTAHAYEPYTTPTTYTANLGRAIYGGTADIVNGVGTGGYIKYVIDGVNNYAVNISRTNFNIMPYGLNIDGTINKWLCDAITASSTNFGYNSNQGFIFIRQAGWSSLSGVTDVASFNAYCQEHPITLILPLATPTDFTFTGQEVPTRLGNNTMWSEQGDTELTYYKSGYGFTSVTVHKETPEGEPVEQTAKFHRIVYGGTADVIRGIGQKAINTIQVKDLNWTYYTAGTNPIFYAINIPNMKKYERGDMPNIDIDGYTTRTAHSRSYLSANMANMECSAIENAQTITFRNDTYASVSDMLSAMGDIVIGYEMDEYETFTFPPISMETDEGENTLFANEGDSAITYRKAVD